MIEINFKVGDIVCLKSSPEIKMTVEYITNNFVTCVYFLPRGVFGQDIRKFEFKSSSLKKCEDKT